MIVVKMPSVDHLGFLLMRNSKRN